MSSQDYAFFIIGAFILVLLVGLMWYWCGRKDGCCRARQTGDPWIHQTSGKPLTPVLHGGVALGA
jgi:hypothetical protein